VGRHRRRGDPPHASHPAHRVRHHARHDSDRANSLLGPDGVRDHRRLAVATVLTLIFLPALYAAWFRIREPVEGNTPPQPEEVAAHA
jgi:hypothetical protein